MRGRITVQSDGLPQADDESRTSIYDFPTVSHSSVCELSMYVLRSRRRWLNRKGGHVGLG